MGRSAVVREFAKSCEKVGITKAKVSEGFASVLHQLAALQPPIENSVACAILDGDELMTMATTWDRMETHKKLKPDLINSKEWFLYMEH